MKKLLLISLMLLILVSVVPAYAETAEAEIHPYNKFWKHRASQIEYNGSSVSDFLGALIPFDASNYYTTSEVDVKLADKADTDSVYTKTAMDILLEAQTHGGLSGRSDPGSHPASAISYTDTYGLIALDIQSVIDSIAVQILTTIPATYATITSLDAYLPLTTIQAAGDLLVGTGSGAVGRIAIGANGTILTSNGTTASWATPSAPDLSSYSTTTEMNAAIAAATSEAQAKTWYPLQMAYNDYTGEVIVDGMVASATVGQCLYLASGGWTIAKADSASTIPAKGLCIETGTGNRKVLLRGIVRNSGWSFTKGQKIYVSAATAGAITATAPSSTGNQVQIIGICLSSDTIYFFFDSTYVEI